MKKLILSALSLSLATFAFAQNDYVDKVSTTTNNKNLYSLPGKIGLNTITPNSQFHIKANTYHTASSPVSALRVSSYWGESTFQVMDGDDFDVFGADMFLNDYSTTNVRLVGGGGKVIVGGGIQPANMPTGYRLGVAGGIVTERIKVKPYPWADYVFESTYKLRPLSEVESYIKENNHLPEIPSTAEVEANNGVELGEFNVLLLKKIEELTLYTIGQEKLIKQQQEELKSISGKFEALQNEVSALKK